ncbi:hypothetical protein B0A55_13688 [Friedmanniomyces simplex]|uniref:F-box domain-containing protein n=1 Tax=Friedmanniomyces simplex TaxID=329884 RepID=A0A4U0W0I1_9PEZI|nr:hypothetical protein B0A55_13688 [Friedmanniomyces simplex]
MAITQAKILNALPPELLARIFSYVFAEFPNDIAACRLVNRSFKQNGSRFLLSRVVFALRLKAITKLREVLKHPYFRFHVTELVCDGSSYAEATAMSSNQYVDDCERAPRHLEDAAWAERQRLDRMARKELDSFRIRNLMMPSPGNDSMTSIDIGPPVNVLDETAAPTMESSVAFRLGCNKTFAEYKQRNTSMPFLPAPNSQLTRWWEDVLSSTLIQGHPTVKARSRQAQTASTHE